MNIDGAIQFSFIYFIIVIVTVAFGGFSQMSSKRKKFYLVLTLSFFAFLSAFRASTVGNDTKSYINVFNLIKHQDNIWSFMNKTDIELGYVLYNKLISSFFDDPQSTFIVSSIFIYLSIYNFAKKWIDSPGMFVCIFYSNLFSFFLSSQRQAISIAILLWAVKYCYERKLIPFILITLLAVTFHNSSILFFFVYPIFKKDKIDNKIYGYIFLATIIFVSVFNSFLSLLLRLFPKYTYYNESAVFDGEPRLAIFLNILVYSLVFAVANINIKNTNKKTRFEMFKVFSVINISLFIVSSRATALARFCNIFNIYALALYSESIALFKNKDHRMLTALSLYAFYTEAIVIILLKTPEWSTTYPYSFCF